MFHTADYLAQKLLEKLLLQLDQAMDFTGLTFTAGPDLVWEWAQLDLDDKAFTPSNYRERQASRKVGVQSVYVLDKSQGTITSPMLACQLTLTSLESVPSESKEYDKLIKQVTASTDKAVEVAGNKKRGKGGQAREALTQAEITFVHLGIQVLREQ